MLATVTAAGEKKQQKKIEVFFKKSSLTFPAASGAALFCRRRLATSILPYFAATCRGLNPFCWEIKSDGSSANSDKWLQTSADRRMGHLF